MNSDEINEIFERAKKDPTLFSTMDIENLLETIENEKHDYLENRTMTDIANVIMEQLEELKMSPIEIEKTYQKLLGYRMVDEIHELHKGKHVRWIRTGTNGQYNTPARLTNGGIVVDIKFLDSGVQVLCLNSQQRFMQYKFDDCITFQKLSTEEQLILMAYEYIS
uniref:Uncharacterized protein n=1 Tax=viral metagenome TaxID=1070528 RepID=A0A6C0D554_9ZZZZ